MNQKYLSEMFHVFFQHQLEIKMYHFQTKHYGAHKATDCYLADKFLGNMDQFLEVAQGIIGQTNLKVVELQFPTRTDRNIKASIDNFISFMRDMERKLNKNPKYVELLALRDELIADAQQLKYLLLFK